MSGVIMDLADIQASVQNDSVLDILHPVKQTPIGLKIRLASPDSEHYRKLVAAMKNRNIALMQRNKGRNISAEALEESTADVLVGAVLGWEGATWGGQPFECTAVNVRQLFAAMPWIQEQVDEYLGNRANFFKH